MDENNRFLDSYKKKLGEQPAEPVPAPTQQDVPPAVAQPGAAGTADATGTAVYRYEEKSGFVPPRAEPSALPPDRKKAPLAVIIVAAVLIIAIAGSLIWYFSRGVQMIDLTGWALSDAQVWANDNGVKLQVTQAYDDVRAENQVVSQVPAAGERVESGGFVRITISLGHDLSVELPLPDIMSMTKTEIESWAAANFMTKVRITTEYSSTVAANRVISFEINDNTVVDKVKRSTPIYVIISRGPEEQTAVQVTLPDFKTMTIVQSLQFAKENKLTLTIIEEFDDYVPAGTITAQSVKAAEKVDEGSEIVLTVSKGKKILVPDFSSYSKEQASATASSLGITVAITEKYSTKKAGILITQSIAAGGVYETGTIVELAYSLGNKIVLASFVGQPRDAIESWAKALNDQGAAITIKVTSTQNSAPKGQIIYQDPASTPISTRVTVKITVSLGLTVFAPDFVAPEGSGYDVAITRDEALALCEALNIIPVFVEAGQTGRLPGEIWYQSLPAGSELYQGATITLKYVPANVTYAVPNLTGKTQAEIIAAGYLKQFDITFTWADAHVAGFSGTVCAQSLPAGSTVAAGSPLILTISPAE